MTERRFRIMDGAPSVPWSLVEPFEAQALSNHDQTLDRLNERGGLSPAEMWCVVHGKRLSEMPSEADALAWLNKWLGEHEGAVAECATLRAEVERLKQFEECFIDQTAEVVRLTALNLVAQELEVKRVTLIEKMGTYRAATTQLATAAKAWRDDPATRSRWLQGVDAELASSVDALRKLLDEEKHHGE